MCEFEDNFESELAKIITELAKRPNVIDSKRVRYCLDNGIPPFMIVKGTEQEAWRLVTDEQLNE